MGNPDDAEATCYSIHDIVRVKSDIDVPVPDRFRTSPFEDAQADLIVRCGPFEVDVPDEELTRCNIFYFGRTDSTYVIDYLFPLVDVKLAISDLEGNTTISITKGFERFGDVTNLFNTVLLFKLVQRDHTFVHSGCVGDAGSCALIAGMRDTGKTSTVLSLVDGEEVRFLSDDLTILGEDGSAYNYPTEVGISPFTLTGPTVSYTGGRLRAWIAKHQLLSFFVQGIVGYELSERKTIPENAIEDESRVEQVFVLGGSGTSGLTSIDNERAADRLLMTTTELIDPFRIYSLNFYAFYMDFDTPKLFQREREIVESAIQEAECYEIRANDLRDYPTLVGNNI